MNWKTMMSCRIWIFALGNHGILLWKLAKFSIENCSCCYCEFLVGWFWLRPHTDGCHGSFDAVHSISCHDINWLLQWVSLHSCLFWTLVYIWIQKALFVSCFFILHCCFTYTRLMTFFQYNLGGPVLEGQTILDFADARDGGVIVASAGRYASHLHLAAER